MNYNELASAFENLFDGILARWSETLDEYGEPREIDELELEEIQEAIKSGLSLTQIDFLASPAFSHYQMAVIRAGFESGVTMEQVKTYAKPEYNSGDMYEIFQQLKYSA